MPGTFSQILLHIVFATKGRWPWLTPPVRGRMHAFLGGIVRDEGGVALAVGGVSDHVHLLVRWKPDGKLSDLLRNLKSRSSLWAHQELFGLDSFAWQEGYAVFSVSKSGEAQVKAYIDNQEEHHKNKDYRVELIELFRLHEITYEQERFVVEELDARLAPAGAPKASTIVATGGCPEGAGTRGKEAKTSPPPRRGGRLLGIVMALMAMNACQAQDPSEKTLSFQVFREVQKPEAQRKPIAFYLEQVKNQQMAVEEIRCWRLGSWMGHYDPDAETASSMDSQAKYEDDFLFGLLGKVSEFPNAPEALVRLWDSPELSWDGGPAEYLDGLIIHCGLSAIPFLKQVKNRDSESVDRLLRGIQRGHIDDAADYSPSSAPSGRSPEK